MSRRFLPLTGKPLGGPEADLVRAEINRLRRTLRRLAAEVRVAAELLAAREVVHPGVLEAAARRAEQALLR